MDNLEPSRKSQWKILETLMHSRDAVHKVKDCIDEMDLFDTQHRTDLGEIWNILSGFVNKRNAVPTSDVYENSLEDDLDTIQSVNRDFNLETTVNAIEVILARDVPAAHIVDYYVDHVLDIYKRWISSEMSANSEQGNWSKVEDLLRKGQTAENPEEELFDDPGGSDPDEYTGSGPRQPTGVPPIDELTSGGPQEGDSMLFVMPTNTGKTTLAVQLSEQLVNMQVPHLYVSLEQQAKGDLSKRIYIRMTGSTREHWELEKASLVFKKYPWIKERFEENRWEWSKYQKMLSGYARPRVELKSLSELFSHIYKFRDEYGIYLQYMIIDWWGILCDKVIQAQKVKSDNATEVRKQLAKEISGYTEEAVENGIPLKTVIFHQVSGNAAEKSKPGSPLTIQSASGDKDLANMFQYAVATTKLDPITKISTFNAEKTRQGEGGIMDFKLHGNECYFDYPSQDERMKISKDRQKGQRTGRSAKA